MSLRIHLMLALTLLVSANAFGQAPKNKRVDFSTLSWSRTINDVQYRNANGEVVDLWIPNGSPSKVYNYFGPTPVRFFKTVGVDEAGNPLEETVATYSPTGFGEQLLIFISDKSATSTRYQILPISFDKSKVAPNSYRFVNLSSFPVYAKFGEDKFSVGVRDEETIQVNTDGRSGMDIAMAVQISDQPGDAKIAYSSAWSIRDGRSALIFITTESKDKGRIDVKRLYF